MKYKVVVTSRIVKTKEYLEIRDAVSHDLIDYCYSQNAIPIIVPNNKAIAESYLNDIDLVVLTGGNDLSSTMPKEDKNFDISYLRDTVESTIIQAAINNNIPILGVCRGMQLLNSFFGGNLKKINTSLNHKSGEHEIFFNNTGSQIFSFQGKLIVKSYHNYGIDKLGQDLIPIARSKDSEIESFRHLRHRIYGMMWHPEREISYSSTKEFHQYLFRDIIEGI